MAEPQIAPESVSRPTLIATLREELRRRADGEMSICRLAAESGVFCRGFRRYSDEELKERFDWIARRRPGVSRDALESIADRWQLARQDVRGVTTSCDVQQLEHDACGGWDDFSDEELVRFARQLTGRTYRVFPE